MTKPILPLAIVLPLLAGCTPNDVAMGSAVRHNAALQTIDPDPQPQTAALPGGNGDIAANAAERYRRGTVRQPATLATTAGGSGGSSGNASGGSGTPR